MNVLIKILLSLPVGLLAAGIAKIVHPSWDIIHLSIFGFIVFAITAIIAIILR